MDQVVEELPHRKVDLHEPKKQTLLLWGKKQVKMAQEGLSSLLWTGLKSFYVRVCCPFCLLSANSSHCCRNQVLPHLAADVLGFLKSFKLLFWIGLCYFYGLRLPLCCFKVFRVKYSHYKCYLWFYNCIFCLIMILMNILCSLSYAVCL